MTGRSALMIAAISYAGRGRRIEAPSAVTRGSEDAHQNRGPGIKRREGNSTAPTGPEHVKRFIRDAAYKRRWRNDSDIDARPSPRVRHADMRRDSGTMRPSFSNTGRTVPVDTLSQTCIAQPHH
ncbi:hypothetical protein EJ06DRAFT_169169 [Trichodelitschia bisporula]|uniref:Uncharacterized protein n=1 Tax=Trichodelitschia bisporula TaxID=703511 RepID=A0A6G1HMN9_9PEZI|nr:hypothetical protein EJ06DRAFT_169169 [Trichodelitschia bisporula]